MLLATATLVVAEVRTHPHNCPAPSFPSIHCSCDSDTHSLFLLTGDWVAAAAGGGAGDGGGGRAAAQAAARGNTTIHPGDRGEWACGPTKAVSTRRSDGIIIVDAAAAAAAACVFDGRAAGE